MSNCMHIKKKFVGISLEGFSREKIPNPVENVVRDCQRSSGGTLQAITCDSRLGVVDTGIVRKIGLTPTTIRSSL